MTTSALLVIAGLLVGVLSSGSGLGGGFLVVPLLLVLGQEARLAVGTSFVFIFFVAASSLVAHYRMGNIDFKTGLILAGGGIIGAQAGPWILNHIPDPVFKTGFGIALVATGVWVVVHARA